LVDPSGLAAEQFGCGFSGGCSIFNPNNTNTAANFAGQVVGGTLSTLGTIANYGLLAASVVPFVAPEAVYVSGSDNGLGFELDASTHEGERPHKKG
jgi:hypothetical protein